MLTSDGHRLKAFSLRMEKEQRDKLEAEAKKNGRTLTGEINHRLEQSLNGAQSGIDHIIALGDKIDTLLEKADNQNQKEN